MPSWFIRRHRRSDEPDANRSRTLSEIDRAQKERSQLLVGKETLVAELEALLFRLDPVGINFDENTDEYRVEAETIALRLPDARDQDDLLRIVHEEFVRWFADSAGGVERYREVAQEIWRSQHPE